MYIYTEYNIRGIYIHVLHVHVCTYMCGVYGGDKKSRRHQLSTHVHEHTQCVVVLRCGSFLVSPVPVRARVAL